MFNSNLPKYAILRLMCDERDELYTFRLKHSGVSGGGNYRIIPALVSGTGFEHRFDLMARLSPYLDGNEFADLAGVTIEAHDREKNKIRISFVWGLDRDSAVIMVFFMLLKFAKKTILKFVERLVATEPMDVSRPSNPKLETTLAQVRDVLYQDKHEKTILVYWTSNGQLLSAIYTSDAWPRWRGDYDGEIMENFEERANKTYVREQRSAILADATLSADDRAYLLRWCDDGCPGDEPTDVAFEDGDFA